MSGWRGGGRPDRGRGGDGRGGGRGRDRTGNDGGRGGGRGSSGRGYSGRGRGDDTRTYEGGGRGHGRGGYGGEYGRGGGGRGMEEYGGRENQKLAPPDMIPTASILSPQETERQILELQEKLNSSQSQHEPSSSSEETQPSVPLQLTKFVPRPGFGTAGKECLVRSNHFMVDISDLTVAHYDVTIDPEVTSRKICRKIIKNLLETYKVSHLGNRTPAYDGRKNMFVSGSFPFQMKEFTVILEDREESSSSTSKRSREFQVTMKHVATVDYFRLKQFLEGRLRDIPQETIQVLDIVLRDTPSSKYAVVGSSFFSKELGACGDLGNGVQFWMGYYQSLRPTQMGLSLNVDISARGFYEPILVSQFVQKYLNLRDFSQYIDRNQLMKVLKGVEVRISYRGYSRHYKITNFSKEPLEDITFLQDDQTRISIIHYFRDKYNVDLIHTSLPAIQVGSDARPVYLPMELCTIVDGQRYTKKLTPKQVSSLLRATCKRPHIREQDSAQIVRRNNMARDDKVLEFGVRVQTSLTVVNARILPPPSIKYHASGRERDVNPENGAWTMNNKKMVNGGSVNFWACVSFSNLDESIIIDFCQQLAHVCNSKGMIFNPTPVFPIEYGEPGNAEDALMKIYNRIPKNKQLHLLIVILPEGKGNTYTKVKRVCETELGIVSQCCQPENVAKLSKAYMDNLSLKINVKAGGRNSVLEDLVSRKLPKVTEDPTIIFGADVTHPSPGDDSSPSIAAVVASMDWPEMTHYKGLVSAQKHREEIIQDLYSYDKQTLTPSGMVRSLLMDFLRLTRRKPTRIVFYRDGVSEGQFSQILLYEMVAIRKACESLHSTYKPLVTFVVVQKRHHTRLFPYDRNLADKSGNVLPGTVVDKQICHPTEFDFYLNSHAGIQGTSRPTHYHVLYDENGFTADELQILTNNLCYTYARCTRSVSLVPPAYYADLLASRARHYIENTSDSGSSVATRLVTQVASLPSLKGNVGNVMFYL